VICVVLLAACALVPHGGATDIAASQAASAVQSSAGGDSITPAMRIDRAAILAVDPQRLPHASDDTWKDFDIAKFEDAIVLDRIARAREAIVRADFALALGELHEILRRAPDFPPALHMSGVLYYRLQRYGDSAHMLARYVEIAPERVGETRMLGHDLYSLGRYDEAQAHYERVLAKAPHDFEALRGLALSLWRLGDGAGALVKLGRVTELAPRNDEAWSWKASIAFDLGDLKIARESAERALSFDAHEPRTWFTLARILEEEGQTEAAATARSRFEALSQSVARVRNAETRLLLDPDDAQRFVAWLDACVAHGAPGAIRVALQRLSLAPRLLENVSVSRAELDACRALRDLDRGAATARTLELRASDDQRAWRALHDWFESIGDAAGAARARARLVR